MICRPIRAEEFVQAEKIMNIAFRFDWDKYPENDSGTRHHNIYGAFEQEEMTSCIVANAYTSIYFGHDVGMLGVGGVATLPQHRRTGHIRRLLTTVLQEGYKRGDVLASLYPFSHPFYRKFGFENGQHMNRLHLDTDELRQFPYTGQVRQFLPGEDDSQIKNIYNTFIQNRNFAYRRREWEWNALKKDPYLTHVYTYLWYADDGKAEAYFTLIHEADSKNFVLRDWAFLSARAVRGVFGFLGVLSPSGEKTEIWLPGDVNPFLLFNEPYAIRAEHTSRGMIRVVNVEKALALHPFEEGTSFTVQVKDEQIAENNGTFSVCRKDGKTTVCKTEETPDGVFSIQAFSLLCCGAFCLEEILFNRTDCEVTANESVLSRAFPVNHHYLREDF